ncbi:unnamed protein product [Diabrotica balteata]|uniref:D-2-hydroxyglutarate dehydrogenase, mitochondrial n=1 Tax=Diabrotica balteata TaxID=107213 RepID=A0A9N9XA83_DIABA|nr:unnamed protein product [Diabrotica balteata]
MFLKIFQNECLYFLKPNSFKGINKRNLRNRPDFTKNRYKVTRGNYNYLREDHINYFQTLLGYKRVIMDLSDLEKYNVDWYTQVRGCSSIVLKPKTTQEVSQILSFCNNQKLALCTQGGNTGVVGGCVPVFDEIIISTELMNDIISLDENSGVLVCQSGCILQNLDNFVAEKGLIIPLDLGAKGTCHIGGNVSTNAGGMRLVKYGNMHANVLGLEVVKSNGEIIDCLSTLKKDNTGYHLKHLFIGSEGTLGLVTKVALQCPPRPKYRNVAFLGLQNFSKVLKTYKLLKESLGEILSAIEVMDSTTMQFISEKNQQTSPIGEYPFYLMVETSGSNEEHDQHKLNRFFEKILTKGLVLNGVVASDAKQAGDIWSIRDNVSTGYKHCGAVFYYDISLPLQHYYTIVDIMKTRMGSKCEKVFGYGHLGDGNIHISIVMDEYSDELKNLAEPYIFEQVLALNGSISAEHGLGFMKAKYLNMVKSGNNVNLMKDLKTILDPHMILNPYKVIPEIK